MNRLHLSEIYESENRQGKIRHEGQVIKHSMGENLPLDSVKGSARRKLKDHCNIGSSFGCLASTRGSCVSDRFQTMVVRNSNQGATCGALSYHSFYVDPAWRVFEVD